MPIDVSEEPLRQRIQVLVSPVAELFNSLHVLADPTHHFSNQMWAEETLLTMPPDLREEVVYFGHHFEEWLNIADLINLCEPFPRTVPAFLESILALPDEMVISVAVYGSTDSNVPAALEQEPGLEALRITREDPKGFVSRLLLTIRRYWEEVFKDEWDRRRDLLEQQRLDYLRRLEVQDPGQWFTTLHSRISYTSQQEELIFHKKVDWHIPLTPLEDILCIPSSFTAPHLMVSYARKKLYIYINVALTLDTIATIPPALLQVAKALADETRLLIYRMVMHKPSYTQEIAAALKLAEPTVSRHLKILKEAHLVQSKKEGPVVLYSGTLEPIDKIPGQIRNFIRS